MAYTRFLGGLPFLGLHHQGRILYKKLSAPFIFVLESDKSLNSVYTLRDKVFSVF